MPYDAYYEARDEIIDFIRRDAFGPVSEMEILQEPPLDNYVCGILWPRKTPAGAVAVSAEPTISEGDGQLPDMGFGMELGVEEEETDVIREANQFRPSVMALSFALPEDAQSIVLDLTAARYENIDHPVEGKDYTLHEYKRIPLACEGLSLNLPKRSRSIALFDGRARAQLVRRRRMTHANLWTLSIENTKLSSRSELDQNTTALFQCQLRLHADFIPIDDAEKVSGDAERLRDEFLCRNAHSYAAGHGCSAAWDVQGGNVNEIRTSFLPGASVSQMLAVSDARFDCFRMAAWTDERRGYALEELAQYLQTYSDWAARLRGQLPTIAPHFQRTARDLLGEIDSCIGRLREGIRTLREDDTAWRAFCLMNRAMMRQSARKRRQEETEVAWYPFQLCYVLMCVPDIVYPSSEWRGCVDLLWFPTGGGKTEAYLGVAAFCIFHRRLMHGDEGRGVTVMMRYTLRMLTSQQFERAAALICECELIRREERLPGGEISVGLWVGGEVTPNHVISSQADVETAETALEKLKLGNSVRCSPVQLKHCPHCGTALLPGNAYQIKYKQFRAHCPNEACPFHDDLPIVTVDDDIYARRPTLLIGTIDKFARLAWEDSTGAIFAVDGGCPPPELLIQDELHLISGPLGSISGLYEIAIQRLMTRDGIPPKILAATATLCNADAQIRALYGKPAFKFPPSGFDSGDSFFARTADASARPERMYIGYCETGGSLSDSIVRVFGTVRFAVEYLACKGYDSEVIDQFWTNVGYFNSLKDLGSAETLLLDRACSYAESLRRHKFNAEAKEVGMTKPIVNRYEHDELTSRKTSGEIAEIRYRLDNYHYPSDSAFSYVLSSNMLSVGIDINRLGLMTVYGQPKSTAEYIQATSRVGRANPGLVIVLLHMLRSRDKGHFEQFQTYHQTLNRMVEPTSATPCACRAMDKALHASFVILLRQLCPSLRANGDAANFRKNDPQVLALRDELLSSIQERSPETVPYAKNILNDFMELWNDAALNRGAHFQYQLFNKSGDITDVLLIPAERSEGARFPPTLNSMRNVDTQSGVFLKERRRT